jgi:hypothetical protein
LQRACRVRLKWRLLVVRSQLTVSDGFREDTRTTHAWYREQGQIFRRMGVYNVLHLDWETISGSLGMACQLKILRVQSNGLRISGSSAGLFCNDSIWPQRREAKTTTGREADSRDVSGDRPVFLAIRVAPRDSISPLDDRHGQTTRNSLWTVPGSRRRGLWGNPGAL